MKPTNFNLWTRNSKRMTRRAQIPITFVFIFAIIVAGLLLTWGIISIGKLINFSQDIDYQQTITTLKENIEKMYYYEEDSSITLQIPVSGKITEICFANKELPIMTQDQGLRFLLNELKQGNSQYNTFFLPLDAFKNTGFNIPKLRGANNPECIKTKDKKLIAKATTKYDSEIKDNYILMEKITP